MANANWMSVNEAYMTKGSLQQLKAFTSSRPRPTLEVLSPLTVCYRHNYPSVFQCFITSSWPPQDVQRKWGIWICFLVCAGEHLRTNTVVICLATRAHNRGTWWVQFQHTRNCILLQTQQKHKNKHLTHTHAARYEEGCHTLTLKTHTTNICCHRDRLN